MKLITLNLNEQQMQVISDALVQMPFFRAAPVIDAINRQVQALHDQAADKRDEPSGAKE